MNPSRWEQIKSLFDQATTQPPEDRAQFLSGACKGDSELELEVKKLLSADDRAGTFLQLPAIHGLDVSQFLLAGQVLSRRFEIVRFLGQGGMGQVYEARDVDLDHRIAL